MIRLHHLALVAVLTLALGLTAVLAGGIRVASADWPLLSLLRQVFLNQTPTADHQPAENVQDAAGVITGGVNPTDAEGESLTFIVTQASQRGTVVVD